MRSSPGRARSSQCARRRRREHALPAAGPYRTAGVGGVPRRDIGLVIGTTDAQAVNQVDQDRIGMATGLLNTVRAGGGTLATTLFGTAVANTLQPWLGESGRAARITAGNLAGPDRMLEAEVF